MTDPVLPHGPPRSDPPPGEAAAPAFWRGIYRGEEKPGWDKGAAAPPIARLVASGAVPRGKVAVPGCGFGWEAMLLARHGFDVWGFDFAPEGIEGARRNLAGEGLCATFDLRDVLTLADAYPGAFDAVCEHTCLAAIPPRNREAYARSIAGALRSGGLYFGLFYFHGRTGGPPFDVTRADVEALFGGLFSFDRFETPPDSFEGRRGNEREFVFRKR
ncbi:MAG: methyltransferase domain-containing protein [Planctomycetes bacterium]|nr:methyltransferase domain-containing protein [Planctomycetota bacterium]